LKEEYEKILDFLFPNFFESIKIKSDNVIDLGFVDEDEQM